MGRFNELVIIIPCYNEGRTIGELVKKLQNLSDIIVIDDCSSDNSLKIAESKGAMVYKNESNLGYHQSLFRGLIIAKVNKYKYCITIDADNQHPIETIPLIYSYLLDGYSVVHTIRSNLQRPSEQLLSFISLLLIGIRDPISGYRGYNLNSFNLSYLEKQFDIDYIGMNLLVYTILNKLSTKIATINISTKFRGDNSRFGIGIKPNCKIFVVTLRIACLIILNKVTFVKLFLREFINK
tara:strand:- start:551 stop:1264 length:714 start_codon:yes stop_codon:yes gene_type:complete